MSDKTERVLVQGTVTFTVNCNVLKALVTPEIANNPSDLKSWLEDIAFKNIDCSDVDVEIDYDRTVRISTELANEHTDELISNTTWKQISENDKEK